MPKLSWEDWEQFRNGYDRDWVMYHSKTAAWFKEKYEESMAQQPTVGELTKHAETMNEVISAVLTGLANGKYDKDVKLTETLLKELGVVLPPVAIMAQGLEFFLWLNKVTAPFGRIVKDGQGGMVPWHNSRVNPDGSLRPWDPLIDGE